MKTYQCPCGYKYSEEKGYPDANIAPGTKYEDLPENFGCPVCGLANEHWKEVKTDANK